MRKPFTREQALLDLHWLIEVRPLIDPSSLAPTMKGLCQRWGWDLETTIRGPLMWDPEFFPLFAEIANKPPTAR